MRPVRHLLQVAGVLAGQEVLGTLADVVLQGPADVVKVVHRPLIEALGDLGPQAPQALRDLHAPSHHVTASSRNTQAILEHHFLHEEIGIALLNVDTHHWAAQQTECECI